MKIAIAADAPRAEPFVRHHSLFRGGRYGHAG